MKKHEFELVLIFVLGGEYYPSENLEFKTNRTSVNNTITVLIGGQEVAQADVGAEISSPYAMGKFGSKWLLRVDKKDARLRIDKPNIWVFDQATNELKPLTTIYFYKSCKNSNFQKISHFQICDLKLSFKYDHF